MNARKCALCWAADGTHNPDCLACEGTGYRPMEDARVNEVKIRANGTGFIAYFADRPINGPYGAGNTPNEARASLTEWMRENRLKEAQDAILTMRFLATHSPDPIAASTADSVAQVLEWAIGGKNDEFEAMIRQTKAEIAAVVGALPSFDETVLGKPTGKCEKCGGLLFGSALHYCPSSKERGPRSAAGKDGL